MALYAISDLHLALTGDKPMDVFGDKWFKHHEKIQENWINIVKEEDTVLVAGDISWSMRMEDGREDLEFIHRLPGKKIFVKGNHDYWWTSITKLNSMYKDMNFIQNNFFTYEDYAICGTRGWITPSSSKFTAHDKKVYERELIRLTLSLDMAKKDGYSKIIVMLHYPPTNEGCEDTGFIDILRDYEVEKVIYGHLHGYGLNNVFEGVKEEVEYILTSCDYINFTPKKII
ncbi:metallophosphoesterase [Clostridium sp. UBA4548]|uniref:metallophosphoesterase n=1 Tax=Clostridium sp. UBA4548 TaxID=1946361 RepID=UPI0025C43698|nr:metallophosphoesterase [Clostridium sp. UBA4548]